MCFLFFLFFLMKILFILLPLILALYFTFSKKHKDERSVDLFNDGYQAWMD